MYWIVTLPWFCSRVHYKLVSVGSPSLSREQWVNWGFKFLWYNIIMHMFWHELIWYIILYCYDYDVTWCGVMWHDMTWHAIWYDMIRYDLISDDIRWYDMIWYDTIRYDTIYVMWYGIWRDVTWHDMVWYIGSLNHSYHYVIVIVAHGYSLVKEESDLPFMIKEQLYVCVLNVKLTIKISISALIIAYKCDIDDWLSVH